MTTYVGAGLSPAGLGPAGMPVAGQAVASQLVPFPDPQTGLAQTGPWVDPRAKDYVYNSSGQKQGRPTVSSLVQTALTTAFNSSAVKGLGLDLSNLQDQGPNFQRQLATVLANALKPLVTAGLVQVVKVVVGQGLLPDAGLGTLVWRDLTAPPIGAGPTGATHSLMQTNFP